MFKSLINYLKNKRKSSKPKMAIYAISTDRKRAFEINKILKKVKSKQDGYII